MPADSALPPAPDIVRSAYGTLVVTDLAEARHFWVDLLGFVVTEEDSSALYLRGLRRAHAPQPDRAGRAGGGGGRARLPGPVGR